MATEFCPKCGGSRTVRLNPGDGSPGVCGALFHRATAPADALRLAVDTLDGWEGRRTPVADLIRQVIPDAERHAADTRALDRIAWILGTSDDSRSALLDVELILRETGRDPRALREAEREGVLPDDPEPVRTFYADAAGLYHVGGRIQWPESVIRGLCGAQLARPYRSTTLLAPGRHLCDMCVRIEEADDEPTPKPPREPPEFPTYVGTDGKEHGEYWG